MSGKRVDGAAQRQSAQGRAGPPVAGGDNDESGVDCGAFANGQLELRLQPAEENENTFLTQPKLAGEQLEH